MHTETGTSNSALRGPKRIVTLENQRTALAEEPVTRLMGDLDSPSVIVPNEVPLDNWGRSAPQAGIRSPYTGRTGGGLVGRGCGGQLPTIHPPHTARGSGARMDDAP